ncbi:MAG: hypothetical protein QOC82_2721 [Frankiaceae bacterium]|jgi:hypothetical protein|nr:hypothetical protein [Frankiaceae bacterium]
MKRRSGVRGARLVSPTTQVDRGGPLAARRVSDYWCAEDHRTSAAFAADVDPPNEWQCRVCSGPSALERGTAPTALAPKFCPRTPYEFLMMRRTEADGQLILADALAAMRTGDYPRAGAGPRRSGSRRTRT